MKTLASIICGLIVISFSVLYGQSVTKKLTPVKIRTYDGSENLPLRKSGSSHTELSDRLRVPPDGDSIAWTYYDYPTNGCSKSNIFSFETGELYVIRMARSNDWTHGPNNRGTYVKFFDGTDWSSGWDKVEGAASGFTDGGVFEDGTGWAVSHTGNKYMQDAAFGAMSWTQMLNNGDAGIWPVACSVGNDSVFYVSSQNGGTGPASGMVFMRTFDRGMTWSNPVRLDSLIVNPYGKELRTAEGYSISAFHNHIAAVQMSYFSATDSTAGMGIVNLYESADYGTTWTRREINPPVTPEPVPTGTTEERAYIDPYALHDLQGRLHIVWSTLTRINDGTNNDYFFTDDNKIMHWSEHTGLTVAAGLPAGTSNSDISGNDMNIGFLGIPSLSFSQNGCALMIYHRVSDPSDTDALGNIYYQIYLNCSPYNGATWYEPVNITNSVGYDNMGANVSPVLHSDCKLYVVYNSDPFTGNYLQGSQTEEWPVAVRVCELDLGWGGICDVGIEEFDRNKKSFSLNQNYPNPFNPSTVIEYDVKAASHVTLRIYNTLGQEVRALVNSRHHPGSYRVVWDGMNNAGKSVSSGVYLYRMEAGGQSAAKKMIFLK